MYVCVKVVLLSHMGIYPGMGLPDHMRVFYRKLSNCVSKAVFALPSAKPMSSHCSASLSALGIVSFFFF